MPRLFAVQLKDGPAERYEAWVNTPVYTHDYEDCVGWLGCELPEDGHSCEFAVLAGDGAVACASSSTVNLLRDENAKLRDEYDSYEQKMDALVWTITGGLLSKSASTPNDVLCSTAEECLTKRLQAENAELRELCSELLRMAESNDPEWLHWPELHDELRELGVENAYD